MKHTAILIFLASCVSAGTVQFQWSASESDVQLNSFNQWDVVSIEEGLPVFANGYPNLPGVPRCYVIPQGTSVTAVEVSNIRSVSLGRSILPPPVMFLPASGDVPHYPDYTEAHFTEISGPFPESPIAGFKTGTKTGFRLGSYTFVPFRYSVDSGELFLITSADITLVYEPDSEAPDYSLTEGQVNLANRGLSAFVDNPEMLNAWAPFQREETDADIEVIIVGYLEHSAQLAELVSLHETLGYTAEYVEVQWIQDNVEGYDTPEQIRNYIIDYYENNGLLFAVLVSDFGESLRHSKLERPDTTGLLHVFTDLYFSDLDGTWDANGNHLYGEEADGVDYYSDIYVGRYPTYITETDELNSMIEKAVQYNVFSQEGAWRERVLLMGAAISPDAPEGPWRFGSKTCDSLASVIPSHWEIHRLYEDSSGYHPNHQLDVFNQGTALAAYASHGGSASCNWFYPLGAWSPILHRDTVEYMTNQEKLPWVLGRMCCGTGNIMGHGLAEVLLEHNGGGAIIVEATAKIAYLGYTDPSPASLQDVYFTRALFDLNLITAGVTHGISKDMFWADWNSAYMPRLAEWHMQQTSLLGDPCTVFLGAFQGVNHQEEAISGVKVSPNPVAGAMSISLALSHAAAIVVTVYDMQGRVVLESEEGFHGQGEHTLTLNASDLASGIYIVQAASGNQSDTAKCVVLR